MTAARIVGPLLLIAISLIIFGLSFNIKDSSVFDPTSASFFPALISLILLACSIAIWRRGALFPSPDEEESSQSDKKPANAGNIATKTQLKQLFAFLFGLFLFAFLMNVVHFLPLSAIYLFLVMTFLNRSKWRTNLLVSVIASSLIYFSFVYLFEIVFPS